MTARGRDKQLSFGKPGTIWIPMEGSGASPSFSRGRVAGESELHFFGLAARAPSPKFVGALGAVLALTLVLFSFFEGNPPWTGSLLLPRLSARLLTDYGGLSVILVTVVLARIITPKRLFIEPPALRALLISFGTYAVSGMAGGVARYHLRVSLGLQWNVGFPLELVANVAAGAVAFTMVGFLASQFYPFVERLDRLRALAAMAEQAVSIAALRDFRGRLSLAGRQDEVGELARTVNELLATVESTIRSHHDFVADTSHELRNPLLAMRTNLELMQHAASREELEECRQESLQQVERMSRLVSDLLTLARLESGQIIERRPVRLLAVLEESVRQAVKRATGQVVRLDYGNEVIVIGDEHRLSQIVNNLVDNALHHTPPGGIVAVSLSVGDGYACVVVSDTGEGITQEHLPHIFERFYQAGRASGGGQMGAGLGLAIVKHLCQAHGGSVSVESEPGKGSRFKVRLPLSNSY